MKHKKEDHADACLNVVFLVVFLYLGSLWGEATLPMLVLIFLAVAAVGIPTYFIFDAIRSKIKTWTDRNQKLRQRLRQHRHQ